MPAVHLSPAQQARVEAGACPCGCGQLIPPTSRRHYATSACRSRAFRERHRTGFVISREEREGLSLRAGAARLERRARRLDQQAIEARRRAAELRARAAGLRARAQGQLQLFRVGAGGQRGAA